MAFGHLDDSPSTPDETSAPERYSHGSARQGGLVRNSHRGRSWVMIGAGWVLALVLQS